MIAEYAAQEIKHSDEFETGDHELATEFHSIACQLKRLLMQVHRRDRRQARRLVSGQHHRHTPRRLPAWLACLNKTLDRERKGHKDYVARCCRD